ncbi:hypothetical protein RJT34_13183 [Clitoria ternatea]|uniref:FIST C-domain domain-containing protein n=1 Tax=Clitoria ternatea TaxID=43366 RepID=A0AAN9PM28_CLITE
MSDREEISRLNGDLIHNILTRLPALSFAAATCVNKTWYHICREILSRPKLAAALSLNPSLMDAVAEVLDRVLSKPIRPDFAIACISEDFGLNLAHNLLAERLGAKTPLVTHISNGVMGTDILTDELKEVQWDYFDYKGPHPREYNSYGNENKGIVLVVGYLPGVKVDAIPLIHSKKEPEITMADSDKFIREIKAFTAAISGNEFPDAIVMFGDRNSDVNSIVTKMDHAMPKETAIVGDAGGCFIFNSLNYMIARQANSYALDAVALVFAKDQNKSPGKTQFHVVMAGGLIPFGPQFEVIDVGPRPSRKGSWLCAKVEGFGVILNIEAVWETMKDMVDDDESRDLYIAVTQHRRYVSRRVDTSLSFYHVTGGEGPLLFIDGMGVKAGDSFMFYHRDMDTAYENSAISYDKLEVLKDTICGKSDINGGGVFGGLIFSCHSRGKSYFGHTNFDIFTFSLAFPLVPVAGMFCKGEIGHGSSRFINDEEYREQCPEHCSRHACSAVYLAMSYHPPPSK